MGDVASLSEHRAKAIAERQERIRSNGIAPAVVDASDLTLDIDAVLAELSTWPGITVKRISPVTVRTDDNVVPLHAPPEEPS